jgi:hypothetical protein
MMRAQVKNVGLFYLISRAELKEYCALSKSGSSASALQGKMLPFKPKLCGLYCDVRIL